MEYQPAYQPASPSKSEPINLPSLSSPSLSEMYHAGYDNGEEDGFRNGEEQGYEKGNKKGYQAGYEDGLEDGYKRGYMIGLAAGIVSIVSVLTVAVLTRPKPSSR